MQISFHEFHAPSWLRNNVLIARLNRTEIKFMNVNFNYCFNDIYLDNDVYSDVLKL